MDDAGRDIAERYAALPLLALPGQVLFPHTLVPVQLFERRFLPALDACLADRRLLVITSSDDELAIEGRIGVLSRVVSDRRLSGGRTTVFLHGLERVVTSAAIERGGSTVVDVRPLPDQPASPDATAAARARLVALTTSLAREQGPAGGALSRAIAASADLGILSHRLASLVAADTPRRQGLLETTSVLARCQALEECLVSRLIEDTPEVGSEAGWIN